MTSLSIAVLTNEHEYARLVPHLQPHPSKATRLPFQLDNLHESIYESTLTTAKAWRRMYLQDFLELEGGEVFAQDLEAALAVVHLDGLLHPHLLLVPAPLLQQLAQALVRQVGRALAAAGQHAAPLLPHHLPHLRVQP